MDLLKKLLELLELVVGYDPDDTNNEDMDNMEVSQEVGNVGEEAMVETQPIVVTNESEPSNGEPMATTSSFVKVDPLSDKDIELNRKLLLREKMVDLNAKYPELDPFLFINDSETTYMLNRLRTHELLMLSKMKPILAQRIQELISSQTFVWFCCNESKEQFFPHEDCCDLCSDKTDLKKDCIEVKVNQLSQVLNTFSQMKFSSLKCLRLFRFTFDEKADQELATLCQQLSHLDLTECKIMSWNGLAKHHKGLNHLILGSAVLQDIAFLEIILNKEMLKTIVINRTTIGGQCLDQFPPCVERIDMRGCPKINDSYLAFSFVPFNNLQYLRIEVNFENKVFKDLFSQLKELILLELSLSNPFNGKVFSTVGLTHIAKLSKLRSLRIGRNIASHAVIPLVSLYKGCPQMQSFALDGIGCDSAPVYEKELVRLGIYWPQLQTLELKNISFGNETMEMLSQLQNLTHLDLTLCPGVNDQNIVATLLQTDQGVVSPSTLHRFPKLFHLVLDKCNGLTKRSYDKIIEKAKQLNRNDLVFNVSLFRCSFYVNDFSLSDLPPNLRLTYAGVRASHYVTFDGIRAKIGRSKDVFKCFDEQ